MLKIPERKFSENKPEVLQHLGNNNYYYNYDIKQDSIIVSNMENEETVVQGYSYIQAYIKGSPEYRKCFYGILYQYISELEEQTLINSYNAHINQIKINYKITEEYTEYIQLFYNVSCQVQKDLNLQKEDIESVRESKLNELLTYDKSEEVNSFLLDGNSLWLDKEMRVGLMNSTNIQKAAGQANTTLWFNNISYIIPCDKAIKMLSALELYALNCYNVTAQHQAKIKTLNSIGEIKAYNFKTNYPEKLNLTTK